MTNKEKFRDQIEYFVFAGEEWALVDEIKSCSITACKNCKFNSTPCSLTKLEWLQEEYKEPEIDWANVPVDTPVLVNQHESLDWFRRYFAMCENGKIYTFLDGRTSWTSFGYKLEEWDYAKLAE